MNLCPGSFKVNTDTKKTLIWSQWRLSVQILHGSGQLLMAFMHKNISEKLKSEQQASFHHKLCNYYPI